MTPCSPASAVPPPSGSKSPRSQNSCLPAGDGERTRLERGWAGWVGFIGSLVVVIRLVHYLQRAYGFASRGWGSAPMGAVIAANLGFMLVNQFVTPAVYSYYFDESVFGVLLAYLATQQLQDVTIAVGYKNPLPPCDSRDLGGFLGGAPIGIRTPDLRFRRPTLYPAEL